MSKLVRESTQRDLKLVSNCHSNSFQTPELKLKIRLMLRRRCATSKFERHNKRKRRKLDKLRRLLDWQNEKREFSQSRRIITVNWILKVCLATQSRDQRLLEAKVTHRRGPKTTMMKALMTMISVELQRMSVTTLRVMMVLPSFPVRTK